MTTEMWPRPVRVKKHGAWAWIDTTLTTQDGVVRPKVIKGDLSLPAGGNSSSTTTFSLTPDQSFTLDWPTDLPAPKLDGSKATYLDAAGPGADLVVTALPTGFRYDVILRTRPAKPLQFKIPVRGQKLALQKAPDGRLEVTNGKKQYVAIAPKPTLRDKETARGRLVKNSTVDTSVRTENGQQTLLLKPNAAFLADPATTYPVTIQSAFSITPTVDADVWSLDAEGADADGGYLIAGTQRGNGTNRAYLKFDISPLIGQNLSNVTLSLQNIDAPSCGTSVGDGIQVRRVTSAWSATSLTWNSQPTNTTQDAVINKAAFGDTCGNPAPMSWDITAMARQWTDDAGNYGVVLMSPTERNVDNYRVYTSMDNTGDPNLPKITATFSPAGGPVTVNPPGPDGVEVFTAPANWRADSLQMAAPQSHALDVAASRAESMQ